jgi:hypothetical protein
MMTDVPSSELVTPRLLLFPASAAFLRAVIDRDFATAGALYQVTVPPSCPGNQAAVDGLSIHLRELEADPRERGGGCGRSCSRRTGSPSGRSASRGRRAMAASRSAGDCCRRYDSWASREAATAVIDWLKTQPEVCRIIATIDDDNAASIRIATHLGMRRTRERHRDTPVYDLTDW